MKEHILLEKAYRYDQPSLKTVDEFCDYSTKKGYWQLKNTGEVMMLSNNAIKPQTKKEDRETGEDQKGE